MFDMLEELAAIHRDVVRDDDSETVSVTLARTYDAAAEDVWDALTNPERLPRWFTRSAGTSRSAAASSSRATRVARSDGATGRRGFR